MSIIPPSKTVNFIIKVTPDTAFSGTGVTSLGGMTGDIIWCGLVCAGNTISNNNAGTALTEVNDTNITMTLGGAPTTAVLSATSMTLGWAGTLAVGRGGTGLISGTSGGIPYYNSVSSMSSSALLTANAFMIGGGSGAAASTVAITALVLGNGASVPIAYGGVTCTNQFLRALSASGGSTCNTVANTGISSMAAATIKMNPTAGSTTPTDSTIGGFTKLASPSATLDFIPIYDHASGTIKNAHPKCDFFCCWQWRDFVQCIDRGSHFRRCHTDLYHDKVNNHNNHVCKSFGSLLDQEA